jgi:hypothetical protein
MPEKCLFAGISCDVATGAGPLAMQKVDGSG